MISIVLGLRVDKTKRLIIIIKYVKLLVFLQTNSDFWVIIANFYQKKKVYDIRKQKKVYLCA